MSLIEQPSARLTALTSGSFKRLAPGDALRTVRLALEAGRAVARHEEQIAELARDARAVAQIGSRRAADGARDRARRRRVEVEACVPALIAATTGAIRLCSQPSSSSAGSGRRAFALRPVDQRHGDAHQRDAVGDRVMHAEHHGRAAVVFFDDMHGPERMVGIERLGGEFADEALERLLAAASRQAHPLDVVGEVEIRVVAPVRRRPACTRPSGDSAGSSRARRRSASRPCRARPAPPASRRRRSSSGCPAGPCAATSCRPTTCARCGSLFPPQSVHTIARFDGAQEAPIV